MKTALSPILTNFEGFFHTKLLTKKMSNRLLRTKNMLKNLMGRLFKCILTAVIVSCCLKMPILQTPKNEVLKKKQTIHALITHSDGLVSKQMSLLVTAQ